MKSFFVFLILKKKHDLILYLFVLSFKKKIMDQTHRLTWRWHVTSHVIILIAGLKFEAGKFLQYSWKTEQTFLFFLDRDSTSVRLPLPLTVAPPPATSDPPPATSFTAGSLAEKCTLPYETPANLHRCPNLPPPCDHHFVAVRATTPPYDHRDGDGNSGSLIRSEVLQCRNSGA